MDDWLTDFKEEIGFPVVTDSVDVELINGTADFVSDVL